MNGLRPGYLAAAICAVLMGSGAAAQAYSAAAVQDAQSLLETATKRFQAGTGTPADLAVAKYNFLEMKQKAGQLSRADFCKAAKPELKAVVSEFDEDASGGKAKWQAQVAAMDTSPADCEQAVTTADATLFGANPRATSADAVQEAEWGVKMMTSRYNAGTATRADVSQAQYELFDAKFGAKQIALKDYCDGTMPLAQTIAQDIDQQAKIGQVSLADVMGAHRLLYRVKAECEK